MACAFDMLGANGDIDLSKVTPQERRDIDLLIISFVDKSPVNGLRIDLPPVNSVEIAGYKFLLAFIGVEGHEGTYYV
jgi:hypothetical protein